MFGFGTWELMIVLGILLLLFGHRLPGMMRSMGRGVTEFKKGLHDIEEDDPTGIDQSDKPIQEK